MTYSKSEKRKHLEAILGYDVDLDTMLDEIVRALDFYTHVGDLSPEELDRTTRHAIRLSHLKTNPE